MDSKPVGVMATLLGHAVHNSRPREDWRGRVHNAGKQRKAVFQERETLLDMWEKHQNERTTNGLPSWSFENERDAAERLSERWCRLGADVIA
jgi:hypothetical protein